MVKVLAEISTKNRYDLLHFPLMSILSQVRLPDRVVIFDDNDNPEDMRKMWLLNYVFQSLDIKGIKWEVVFGQKRGQHHNHQLAQTFDCDFVWRLDDDCYAEPNVLETLLRKMKDDVGAVGGKVLTPPVLRGDYNNSISDIYSPNVQWSLDGTEKDVDHLNCSFLYRSGIAHYNLDLSPVAHREETLFTYEIKRAGYKVLFTPDCTTWHLRAPFGGIRTGNGWMFQHDEKLFQSKLKEWGIEKEFLVYLECGLGDHIAFSNLIPEFKEKYKNLVLAVSYPDPFKDMGVKLISLVDAQSKGIDVKKYSIYNWMADHKWTGHITDAFREMYKELS